MIKIGVLHVILNPAGGAWSVVRELSRQQRDLMPTAIGISSKPGLSEIAIKEANALDLQLFLYEIPYDFPYSSIIYLPPLHKWLNELSHRYKKIQWVVHFHNGSAFGPFLLYYKILGIRFTYPTVNTFHGLPPEDVIKELRGPFGCIKTKINAFFARYMCRNNVRLITLSQVSKKEIVETYKVPNHLAHMVPNGTSRGPVHGCPRLHKNNKKTSMTVGFIGYLGKKKRVDIVIDAVLNLALKGKDINLLIAGEGPFSNFVKAMAKKQSKFITYLGKVQNAAHWLMPKLDVLVLPTLHEGMPMVILEAMACGVPSIASRVGGIGEVITNYKNGILLEKTDVIALIKAINSIYHNHDLHASMSEACIDEWKKKYSIEIMERAYFKQYRFAIQLNK